MNKKQLNQSQSNTKYDISLGSITKNVLTGDNNNGIISIGISYSSGKPAYPVHHAQKADTIGQKSFIAISSQITNNLLQGDQKIVKSCSVPPTQRAEGGRIATLLFNPLTMRLKTQITKNPEHDQRSIKGDALQVKKDNKSTKLGKILKQISKTNKIKGHSACSAISEKNLAQLSIIETSKKYSNHYKGIQIRVSGRLRGAQRARSLLLNNGRISTQSFNSALKFNKKQIPTK